MSPNVLPPPDKAFEANYLPDLCRKTITEFLYRTNIPLPDYDPSAFDDEVDRLARAEVQTWNIGDVSPRRFEHCLVTGIDLAKTAFRHTPINTQVHLALWMALCTCLDDFALEADAMAGFAERFHAGHEQLHPLLGLLVEKLRQMPEFFHSYGAAAVVAGTVQFVICTVMEKKTETMEVHPAAREYPVYKRFRTGVGEASAFCIWDKAHFPEVSTHIQMIPDASKCVCYVNDLLSFYKEELIGEKNNFIHDRARVAGTGAEHALTDTLEDAVNAVNAVQEILQGEDEKKSWESFVTGYVAFHFMTPRYKLKQLFNASD